MFETVKECAEECQQLLEKPAAQGSVLNFKDVSIGYTIEVINSTAFGWKSNSIADSESEFKKINRALFNQRMRFTIRNILHTFFPYLKSYINIRFLPSWIRNFFFDSVRETVEYRKKTGYKRNDFLQLLMALNETSEESENIKITTPHKRDNELSKIILQPNLSIKNYNAAKPP